MTSHSKVITADELTSERVKRFREYWRGKCMSGSPPPRAAIDPAEIPRLLPYVVIVEIEPEPFRIRYRLVGTRVADSHGADYTNRYLDECGFAVEPLLVECYRRMVATRAPVFACYEWNKVNWRRPRGAIGASETGFFPLSSDGTAVDGAISIADSDVRSTKGGPT